MLSTEPGTGFLQRRGFALASVTWEYGEGIVVAKFRDASGEERNVEAAAFAAIRDVALFLRDGSYEETCAFVQAVRDGEALRPTLRDVLPALEVCASGLSA